MLDSESYDTINLVHNADFEVFVSKDLYWVPVNVLGKTRFKNSDMEKLVDKKPAEKQAMRFNLYEAIQLFQVCQFDDKEDVLNIEYKGMGWEHHKPGYFAVLSNFGCCSSIATWLDYIVSYQYKERGYLEFTRPDGTGHVINFIYHKDFYYIIDISAMVYNRAAFCRKESGNKQDLLKSKYITGRCYKTNNLANFVKYHSRIQKFHNIEFLYYKIAAMPYIPPISVKVFPNKSIELFVSVEIELLNRVETIKIFYDRGPNYSPNWNCYMKNY
jgi:hypothetical protein